MNGRGYRAEALHGGMSQEQRDRVMGRLRAGTADLLVATDVAARGLDVEQLTHVVNYDVPSAPESYVHRIGRVGRAGREGVAITLAEPREHRMLKTIERVTGQRITIDKIPTVADLRTRRLELTQAALRESLLEDDLDPFRVIVESLTDEFDLMEVALAAVKLAHEATPPGADRRGGDPAGRGPAAAGGPTGAERPGRRPAAAGGRPRRRRQHRQVFIGLGRRAGVRPQDLVGAITGETGLSGRDIGSIEIADRFSLVEVPQGVADEVIAGLRGSTIKGRKATVRRDRGGEGRWTRATPGTTAPRTAAVRGPSRRVRAGAARAGDRQATIAARMSSTTVIATRAGCSFGRGRARTDRADHDDDQPDGGERGEHRGDAGEARAGSARRGQHLGRAERLDLRGRHRVHPAHRRRAASPWAGSAWPARRRRRGRRAGSE